jgi:hypothetical protein
MRRADSTHLLRVTATLLCTLTLLNACQKQEATPGVAGELDEPSNELRWARAALERNPDLKVVSVDKERNTIKVVVKASGEMMTVTPGELAALPIGDLVALNNAVKTARDAIAPHTLVEETIPVSPAAQAETAPVVAAKPERNTDYKVEREDGRTRISGPGMTIESTDTAARSSASSPQPRFDEPIICEGPHMLHLDRRHLNVDGDAIIARGGCELHLTNSQITATGTALVIQDATVHIGNSTVQGSAAAFEAAANAKLILLNSRFVGLTRREAQTKINDQGGNSWR